MQRVTASTDKQTEIYPGIILSNYGTHFKSSVQPFIYNPYERKLRTYQRVWNILLIIWELDNQHILRKPTYIILHRLEFMKTENKISKKSLHRFLNSTENFELKHFWEMKPSFSIFKSLQTIFVCYLHSKTLVMSACIRDMSNIMWLKWGHDTIEICEKE